MKRLKKTETKKNLHWRPRSSEIWTRKHPGSRKWEGITEVVSFGFIVKVFLSVVVLGVHSNYLLLQI